MGAYLSEPITDKVSTDEEGARVICGASSMQGWRKTQEDAHNCILEYDPETSFFAVYDGHGGHEVAEYSADHLPEYLKTCDAYKMGDYTEALKDAFLGFDAMLTTPKVKKTLRQIANSRKDDPNSASEEDEEENVKNLYEEAKMPLEQVMAKYQNDVNPKTEKLKQEDSKPPASPYLRARRSCDTSASSSKMTGNGSDDGAKANTSNGDTETLDECTDNADDASVSIKVSDSDKKNEVNGEVSHDEKEEEPKENSCDKDESSKPHENGEIAEAENKGKGKRSESKPKEEKKRSSLRLRNASAFYHSLLGSVEQSDSDSDDEGDESFEGADNSGDEEEEEDDDDEGVGEDESEEEEDSALDEEDEEEEDDDEDEDEEEDDDEDDFTLKMTEEPGWDSGCTAVVALLKERELYVANAGDSRCIVCRKGQSIEMSLDHKPEDEAEMKRIVKAGGKVNVDGRVNGGLNLSRALGDHGYKQREGFPPEEQMITALPDVRTLMIDPDEDEFMVLACDGIWNFMSSQDVVDFVRPRVLEGKMKLSQICEELFDHCLAPDTLGDGTGCDNMTAVIVKFQPSLGETKSGVKRPASPSQEEADTNKRPKTENVSTSKEEGILV